MSTSKNIKIRFPWNANFSSSGRLSLTTQYPEKKIPEKHIYEEHIAGIITMITQKMIERGYVNLRFSKLSSEEAKSFWLKLIRNGDIPYSISTTKNRISINLWVEGYIGGKFDNYVEKLLLIREEILQKHTQNRTRETLICPNCKENSFTYNFNEGRHINGLCSNCHFRIDTQKNSD